MGSSCASLGPLSNQTAILKPSAIEERTASLGEGDENGTERRDFIKIIFDLFLDGLR